MIQNSLNEWPFGAIENNCYASHTYPDHKGLLHEFERDNKIM